MTSCAHPCPRVTVPAKVWFYCMGDAAGGTAFGGPDRTVLPTGARDENDERSFFFVLVTVWGVHDRGTVFCRRVAKVLASLSCKLIHVCKGSVFDGCVLLSASQPTCWLVRWCRICFFESGVHVVSSVVDIRARLCTCSWMVRLM